MPQVKLPWPSRVWYMFRKELQCELRTRYVLGELVMFVLITLASVSMAIAGNVLSPAIAATLLWVIIFFSAMAGLARSFMQELEMGTLLTLRVYAGGQTVLAGKLLYNIMLLLLVTLVIIPLFILFFNLEIQLLREFLFVVFLGTVGLASVATLTTLMVTRVHARGSLFTVITFPVLLPHFLTAITATRQILTNITPGWRELFFLAGYDLSVIVATSLLFDFLWYD